MSLKRNRLMANLLALLAMFFGSSMVFASVLIMNDFSVEPAKKHAAAMVDFEVQRLPKKEEPRVTQREEPKPKPTKKSDHPLLAPAPMVGGEGGLVISAGEFAGGDDAASGLVDSLLSEFSAMSEDKVDRKPVALSRPAIEYPARARDGNITGYVALNLLIGTDGRVRRVRVLEARPAGYFEEAATAAASGWTFEPATYQGQRVEVWARQTVRFELD